MIAFVVKVTTQLEEPRRGSRLFEQPKWPRRSKLTQPLILL